MLRSPITGRRWFTNNFLKDLLMKEKLTALNNRKPVRAKKQPEQDSARKLHKKVMDKNSEDIHYQKLPNMQSNLFDSISSYLQNENAQREYLSSAQLEKTQRIARSLKTNSLDQLSKDKGRSSISADYNNYEKYYKNYTEFNKKPDYDMEDNGETFTHSKINSYLLKHGPNNLDDTLIGQAKAEEAEEESISKKMSTEAKQYFEMGEDEPDIEEDSPFYEHRKAGYGYLFDYKSAGGRVSPVVKEELFMLWSQGWNVEELSLRYGILPNRVKAIIWCKRYFYEEVQPNIDNTTWRLAIEREYVDASIFPFVDYGLDLEDLAKLESGTPNVRLTSTHIDVNPPPEIAKKIQDRLDSLPKPFYSYIDRNSHGKGLKKYKIKDMVVFKGNGRVGVSEMFKKVCYWSDSKKHWLPKQVAEKISKGPRAASTGYRLTHNYILK